MPQPRARLAIAVVILAVIGVAGCATRGTPASDPIETPAPLAVTVPMPDLGPAPVRDRPADEQAETLRLAQLDSAWERVVAAHPNAVRPDVTFAGFVTSEQHTEVVSACFTEMAVPFGLSTDADGTVNGMEWTTDLEEHAVGAYVCQARHSTRPTGPPTDAQLAWMYDYLTQFLVPCYEANGIENPPAPPREDFIAGWPNLGWFPGTGNLPTDTPKGMAVVEACPPPA
ncbi:hypothetical protein [Salinibacterium sp. ZJ454]|uniref:hypothetical protein n=1 Tax=Salinibacterium sp. ZJ454 TaxID=2708339 RepID=UPI00141F8DC7|nr:hypothetical protein [Salinibacterium sp. ZJ454]